VTGISLETIQHQEETRWLIKLSLTGKKEITKERTKNTKNE